MKLFRYILVVSALLFVAESLSATEDVEPLAPITGTERCAVCGMFVAKYPAWISQLKLNDSRVMMFDGPKDMFVFYFSPNMYGAGGAAPEQLLVKDYYTRKWISGREALYVTGSDVFGPMGHELVPFESREAAENFLKDHHGKNILAFEEVTDEIVQAMRMGHKMKHKMKK